MENKNWNLIDTILKAPKKNNENLENIKLRLKKVLKNIKMDSDLNDSINRMLSNLESVSNFPFLYSKNIIAIGGGFSSGKSSFINTLIDTSIARLNTNINPTTAIPTYVLNNDEYFVSIYSKIGGVSNITNGLEKDLEHDNLKKLGFNITNIMPYIVMGTKFKTNKLENICFIDTPGYDSASTNTTKLDRENSIKYLKYTNSILWVVDVTSGTLKATDLEYLENISDDNKKIYIILNKADLRRKEQIEEIIDEITDSLENEAIDFEGIQAYSTVKTNIELPYRKKTLEEFLNEENKIVDKYIEMESNVEKIFNIFVDKILENIKILNDELEKLDNFLSSLDRFNIKNNKIDINDIAEYVNIIEIMKREAKINILKNIINSLENDADIILDDVKKIYDDIKTDNKNVSNIMENEEASLLKIDLISRLFKSSEDIKRNDFIFQIEKDILDTINKFNYISNEKKNYNTNINKLSNILNNLIYQTNLSTKVNIGLKFLNNKYEKEIKEDILKMPYIKSNSINKYSYDEYNLKVYNNNGNEINLENSYFNDFFELYNTYELFFENSIKQITYNHRNSELKDIVFTENSDLVDKMVYIVSNIDEYYSINMNTNPYIILTSEINLYEFEKYNVSLYKNGELKVLKGKSLYEYIYDIKVDRANQLFELVNELINIFLDNISSNKNENTKLLKIIKEFNLEIYKNAMLDEIELEESISDIKQLFSNRSMNSDINELNKLENRIINKFIKELANNDELLNIVNRLVLLNGDKDE